MIRLLVIAVFSALAFAKPELYKETEDFQYSRSSSDEGSKSGFYGAQRGNMGGNFEKAHNMDGLAQHQMSGLVRTVDGELGDGYKTRTGSVYSAANSRGIYGTGNYDLSNLQGRNFGETESFGGSHSSRSSQSSGFRGQAILESGARRSSERAHSSGYRGYMEGQESQQFSQKNHLKYLDNSEKTNEYDHESQAAQYLNSGFQSHRSYDQSNANVEHSGVYETDSSGRILTGTPVRVIVRPGTRLTVPFTAQTYDKSHTASSFDLDRSNLNREAELLSSNGQTVNYRPSITTNPKHYESSYSYHKAWEKHDTQPVTTSVVIPTENPFHSQHQGYDETLVTNTKNAQKDSNLNLYNSQKSNAYNANSKSITSSRSRYQAGFNAQHSNSDSLAENTNSFTAGRHSSSMDTNVNGYDLGSSNSLLTSNTNGYNRESRNRLSALNANGYNTDSRIISSISSGNEYNARTQQSKTGSGSMIGTDSSNLVESLSTKPKSYHSSYSYHKAWERQGDPYVIKPASSAALDGLTSQKLTSASSSQEAYSHHYGSHYKQANQDFSQNGFGVDCDENDHIRVARSYDPYQETFQNKFQGQEHYEQQSQSHLENLESLGQHAQSYWDNLHNLGQETQNQWDNIQDLNQQTEEKFDKLEDLNQQTYNQWDNMQDLSQQPLEKFNELENLGQQTQNQWDNIQAIGQQSQEKFNKLEDLGQQTQNQWDNTQDISQQTQENFNKLEDLGQQTRNQWDNTQDINEQTQEKFNKLEDLGQQTQNQWNNMQDINEQTQQKFNKLEDLGQQTQNQWDNTQDISQQTQEKFNKLEDLGQQTQKQLDNTQDISQQTQEKFNELEYLGQQTENQWDNTQDISQQTQDKFNNLEDLGQQTQNQWDTTQDISQKTQEKFNKQEVLDKKTQKPQDNTENLSQQTQEKFDKLEHLGLQKQNKRNNFENLDQQTLSNVEQTIQTQGLEDSERKPEFWTENKNQQPERLYNMQQSQNSNYNIHNPNLNNWMQNLFHTDNFHNQQMYNTLNMKEGVGIDQQKQFWQQYDRNFNENVESSFTSSYNHKSFGVPNSNWHSNSYNNHYNNHNNDLQTQAEINSQSEQNVSPLGGFWDKLNGIATETLTSDNDEDIKAQKYDEHNSTFLTQPHNDNNSGVLHYLHKQHNSTSIASTTEPKPLFTNNDKKIQPIDIGRGDIGPEEDTDMFSETPLSVDPNNTNKTLEELEALSIRKNLNVTSMNSEQQDVQTFHDPPQAERKMVDLEDNFIRNENNGMSEKSLKSTTIPTDINKPHDENFQRFDEPNLIQTPINSVYEQHFTNRELPTHYTHSNPINYFQTNLDQGNIGYKPDEEQYTMNQQIEDFSQQTKELPNLNEFENYGPQLQTGWQPEQNLKLPLEHYSDSSQLKDLSLKPDGNNNSQKLETLNNEFNNKKINELQKVDIASPTPLPPESETEKPGFWKSVGSKLSNAKDKVFSWFGNK